MDSSDPSVYYPNDPVDFSVWLRIMIGPDSGDGEESFDVEVMSIDHLIHQIDESQVVFGMWKIIVSHYDYSAVESAILRYTSRCTGKTWSDVAGKLRAFALWEFE